MLVLHELRGGCFRIVCWRVRGFDAGDVVSVRFFSVHILQEALLGDVRGGSLLVDVYILVFVHTLKSEGGGRNVNIAFG